MLELPTIIMHAGRALSFLHPCFRVPTEEGCIPKHSIAAFVEVQCTFIATSAREGSQKRHQGSSKNTACELPRPPLSLTTQQGGGVICIQVRDEVGPFLLRGEHERHRPDTRAVTSVPRLHANSRVHRNLLTGGGCSTSPRISSA